MVSKYYSTKEHNFDSLSSGYFFMNRPDAFNDPFDCRSIIYFQGSDKQWKDYFKKKGYDSEKVNTLVKEYSGKRIYADFIKQHQFEKIDHAIACFADSENNPLMWSHYADSHKGFCIRFITQSIDNTQTIKIKKSQLKLSDEYSDSLFILPVTYISRMPEEYNVFSYNINDLVKFYTTKEILPRLVHNTLL